MMFVKIWVPLEQKHKQNHKSMERKRLNRLKVVLAEKKHDEQTSGRVGG